MSSEENQNLHFKIGNIKPWPLPAPGHRAEWVHDMVLQIPGRCCCRCNATLIQGWPAVEQYKLTLDKLGHLLQLAAANAGTPAKTLWFCACSSPPPGISLWAGRYEAAVAVALMRWRTFWRGRERVQQWTWNWNLTHSWKVMSSFTHLLLTPRRMQALAAFCNPHSPRFYRWKEFHPMGAQGCLVVRCKEIPKDQHNMLPCCLCGVIQVSAVQVVFSQNNHSGLSTSRHSLYINYTVNR